MHIDWVSLLQHYGYVAVFIGAFFEGETVMLLGAYAVHQHWMSWLPLVAVGAVGSFIGDQVYYQLGYHQGQRYLQQRPQLQHKFERASRIIEHYPTLTILLMRFAWGLRIILPVSYGIRRYRPWHYVAVNVVACVLWAVVVTTIGVTVSEWLHRLFGHIPKREVLWALLLLLSVGLVVGWQLWRNRRTQS